MKNGLCLYQHQVQRLNVCKLVQIDNEFIVFGQVQELMLDQVFYIILHKSLSVLMKNYEYRIK